MKSKNLGQIFAFAVILALVASLCYRAGRADGASGGGVPGSAGDPLITRSYLEERLSQIQKGEAASFQKVTLIKGEELALYAGSEMMLYSGNAAVRGADGLVNLTTGELFKKGNSTVRYHLYFAPVDGSGIKADSNVTVYVRGNYWKD
jgi:hypothetical protein